MKRVRHIATSWNGHRVAVGKFEGLVAVWDVELRRKVSEFETVLDFGGERLAITSDGQRVVAGAYARRGIASYRADTGEQTWCRKDLKKVQSLIISSDDQEVYCGFEGRAGQVLSMADGETRKRMAGVEQTNFSPYSDLRFVQRKAKSAELRTGTGTLLGRIGTESFAFLDAAFAPKFLLTTESTGPVRCFRVDDAAEVWRYEPEAGTHALKLCYDDATDVFQAVFWPYVKGGDHVLRRFEPATGRVAATMVIPSSSVYGFCRKGDLLLTWDGSLVKTQTGETLCKMSFPDTSLE